MDYFNRNYPAASYIAVAALSVLLFVGPIVDVDAWWHINSGRWIWSHHALPDGSDPFSIYPDINHWGRTILQGQWGGQVLLFLAFDALGHIGVIVLRVLTLGAVLALAAWMIAWTSATRVAQAIAVVTVGLVLSGFAADRPQMFSLLLFAVLIVVLQLADRRRIPQWWVPLILAAWTNLHQGVLLGAIVAAIHLSMTAWKNTRQGDRRSAIQSGLMAVGALLSPLATPNGINGIEYLVWLEFLPAKERISEYASPFAYVSIIERAPHLVVFYVLVPLLLWTLARQVRQRPEQCVIPGLLLAAAMMTYRYIPFAVIVGVPFLLKHWPPSGSGVARKLGISCAAMLVGLSFLHTASLRLPLVTQGVESPSVTPIALVAEAKRLGTAGSGFSTVGWGGYVAWHLDRSLPFIDGRYLMNPARLEDYTHILWATPRGLRLFEQSGFEWVLMPHRNAIASTSQPYPLIAYLRSRPDWRLNLETEQGVLFSRISER